MLMDMNKKTMKKCGRASRPEAPLHNEKSSLPGQQIGLYNCADADDVKQMVQTLNSPGEQSQQDRG